LDKSREDRWDSNAEYISAQPPKYFGEISPSISVLSGMVSQFLEVKNRPKIGDVIADFSKIKVRLAVLK